MSAAALAGAPDVDEPLRTGAKALEDAAVVGRRHPSRPRGLRGARRRRRGGRVGTTVGWAGVMGFGMGAFLSEPGGTQRSMGLGALGSGVVAITGIGFTLGGQVGIQNAVQPGP